MKEITQEEFENNFDHYMDLIEKEKTEFIIRLPDGKAVAALPFPDDVSLDMLKNLEYSDFSLIDDDDTTSESDS
jgi:hypothetical protein